MTTSNSDPLSTEGKTVPAQGSLHTAGPWRALQRPHTKGPPSTDPADAHLDYFNIQAGKFGADGWEISGYLRPADACLIAAAPDLLAALTDLMDCVGGDDIRALQSAVHHAETARKKAEGRS